MLKLLCIWMMVWEVVFYSWMFLELVVLLGMSYKSLDFCQFMKNVSGFCFKM